MFMQTKHWKCTGPMAAAVAAALLVAGCATPAYVPTVWYVLEPEPQVAPAQPTELTLGIRPIQAAKPYKQPVVYRDGQELGMYPGIQWAELPGTVVTRALTEALLATGRFRDVGNAADMHAPDLILVGQLLRLDERHAPDGWTAECELRIEVRRALGTQVAVADTFRAEVPLERSGVDALPEAMNRALAEVVSHAATRIAGQELEN
ncbi:MAG: hypothetical protein GWP08_05720 [Nitrospiraceae bacterium]|nr:hypothetical protein [Nitrospiraceae bacterium]